VCTQIFFAWQIRIYLLSKSPPSDWESDSNKAIWSRLQTSGCRLGADYSHQEPSCSMFTCYQSGWDHTYGLMQPRVEISFGPPHKPVPTGNIENHEFHKYYGSNLNFKFLKEKIEIRSKSSINRSKSRFTVPKLIEITPHSRIAFWSSR
jgi:hypothetical protein